MLLLTTAGASYKAAPDLASVPNTALTPCLTLLVTYWGKETCLLVTGHYVYRGGTLLGTCLLGICHYVL